MSAIGGSIITTEGLNTFVETGTSVVPKYFKFSSTELTLDAALTDADMVNSWIQKDISLYQTINENTIEFVCDVLPGDATSFTGTCGLYLEDGTLFMVATPPNAFPSGLRQTFRIQLVYANAANMMDFQYIDMDLTNMHFVEVEASIQALDDSTDARMTVIENTHETDSTASMARLDVLETTDSNVSARIDGLETLYTANKNSTDSSISTLQSNRTQDLLDLASAQLIQDNRLTVNEDDIDDLEAKSILDRTELDARIDDVITNSDTGTMRQDIDANTLAISTNYSTITDLIDDNATADAQDKVDVTNLITAETNARIAADSALDTRVSNTEQSITTNYNSVTSNISTINALIVSNKSDLENGIQSNTDAIAALGSTDTSALQNQLDLLEGTVTSNNTNINNALTASDNASDTWNDNQDDAIALNTFFRTDTFSIAQGVQDQALIDATSAQDTINTDDNNRLVNLEALTSNLPDAGALDDLLTDMDEMATLTGEMIDGTQTVGHALTADKWTTARTLSLTGDVTGSVSIDGSSNVSLATTVTVEALPAGGDVGEVLTNTGPGTGTWQPAAISYTHPTYTGDDFSIDTGALTGATIISDIDINVTTDTFGHVTDTNATIATRTLTAANIGAAASSHTHAYLPLTGGTVTGASEFTSNLQLQKLTGLTTFGDNARNSNNIVRMRVNSGYKNLLEMVTGGQGDSEIFMGQTDQHGGGFIYNADDSPDDIGTADVFSAVRTTGGVRYQQFSWHITDTDVTFNGDVIANSDIRVKDNIRVIENAMDKIEVLRGVTFNRTDLGDTETRMTGVIAQEVQAVLPEAVKADQDGKLSVAYGNMVGLLIQGMKEQSTVIKEMQIEIDTLKEICE